LKWIFVIVIFKIMYFFIWDNYFYKILMFLFIWHGSILFNEQVMMAIAHEDDFVSGAKGA
jgi:hypothetical protein